MVDSKERFRRPDYSHLEFEVVIDDPGAYTRPFTGKRCLNVSRGISKPRD